MFDRTQQTPNQFTSLQSTTTVATPTPSLLTCFSSQFYTLCLRLPLPDRCHFMDVLNLPGLKKHPLPGLCWDQNVVKVMFRCLNRNEIQHKPPRTFSSLKSYS